MSDYSDLIEMLRDDYQKTVELCGKAADALEAQAKRIAELEIPLCIGGTTIRILAKEGAKVFEDGRGLVAADELFKQDPYDRIAELEAALKPFAQIEPYICSHEERPIYAFTEHMSKAARKVLGEKE